MKERKPKSNWSWKTFWIVLLIIYSFYISYEYSVLEDNYKDYQNKVQLTLKDLELNLTKNLGETQVDLLSELSNYQCYDKSVYCYTEPQIGYACDEGYYIGCIKN